MKKEKKYSDVLNELEALVDKMGRGEITIDELGAKVKDASGMILFLKEKLKSTEMQITRILNEMEERLETKETL